MRGYMFKNRWGALLFVCLTALGAASLIGGEDDQGVLLSAADELTKTGNDFGSRAQELSETEDRPVLDAGNIGQFTPDDDLLPEFEPEDELSDNTQGLEPEPGVDPATQAQDAEEEEEEGEVIMYIEDS